MSVQDFLNSFQKLDLPINGVRLPTFIVEEKYLKQVGLTDKVDNYTFLSKLCEIGFAEKLKGKDSSLIKTYSERLKQELEIINELGFVDYMLLVWDVINFCKENNIPTGYGRGSAAGSLVLFLIDVTKVDPLKHGLYFERFISRIRAKKQIIDGVTYLDGSLMVDVDLDICFYNRYKVIDYLENKFKGRICKILTFNTLSAKLLIKECGKIVSSKSEDEMNKVTDMVPKLHGKVYDLLDAYHGVKDKETGKWKLEPVQELVTWCDNNKKVFDIALKLRDLIKNKGVHPSAISISYNPIDDFTPTELDSEKNEVSSYDMNWISLFNVKLDVLGLRGVSVVDDVCKNVGIKMSDIDFDNPMIYQNLQELKTPHGIFQLEAETNLNVSNKVKPKNLEELGAVLALARPGALQFVDQFANFTNFGEYEAIHPFFDEILKPTGGVAVYQEQLMRMSHKIGFTLDEAEILRRIVGKKKVEEVAAWQSKIEDKVKINKLDKQISKILWKILEDSASYSFNKSHSLAYAYLAAATVFLKFTYPTQFFLSLLRMSKHEPDSIGEISKIHKEMVQFDIQLLRPHITKSNLDFTIEDKNIRFGLLSIKGIAEKSIEKLNKFKNEYSTKFEVFEGAEEAGLNNGILCALIQAGAFEGFTQPRSAIVYEAQLWNLLTTREKQWVVKFAEMFEFKLVNILLELSKRKDEKGKPIIKPSRIDTIKRKSEPYKSIYELNKRSESFANWYYEKKLLGYTHNKTLRDIFVGEYANLASIKEIKEYPENTEVNVIVSVEANSQMKTSKAGNKYLSFDCSDETGTINVKLFTKKLTAAMDFNDGKTPKIENIVFIYGKKMDGNCIFADSYTIKTNKIYTRLADLKKEKEEVDKKIKD